MSLTHSKQKINSDPMRSISQTKRFDPFDFPGGLIDTQEFLGEMGASLVSNAVGLENAGFKTHAVHGIDQLRRSETGNFWAVIEAKGGRSRLGSTIHTGKQMSPRWIRHWIDDTIDRNPFHQDVAELSSLKSVPHPNLLAAVVRVNATGKRWELKLTVNKMKWTTPTLNWGGA